MKWLLDENLSTQFAVPLIAEGHDVICVTREYPGNLDPDVMALAAASGRVIVTQDKGFGELVFRRVLPPPPGVVLFRALPDDLDLAVALVASVLLADHVWVGRFTTVDADSIRIRAFPARP